jgi:hypothetical protein
VQVVFKLCPRALQGRSSEGLLPLHVAAQFDAPLDVIYFLARAGPRAVGDNRLPVKGKRSA